MVDGPGERPERRQPPRAAGLLLTGLRVNELLRLEWTDVIESDRRLRSARLKDRLNSRNSSGLSWRHVCANGVAAAKRGRVVRVDDLRAALNRPSRTALSGSRHTISAGHF